MPTCTRTPSGRIGIRIFTRRASPTTTTGRAIAGRSWSGPRTASRGAAAHARGRRGDPGPAPRDSVRRHLRPGVDRWHGRHQHALRHPVARDGAPVRRGRALDPHGRGAHQRRRRRRARMDDRARGRTLRVSEADLLTRVAAGDERALATLYDQTSPLAYGLALRVVGSADTAE